MAEANQEPKGSMFYKLLADAKITYSYSDHTLSLHGIIAITFTIIGLGVLGWFAIKNASGSSIQPSNPIQVLENRISNELNMITIKKDSLTNLIKMQNRPADHIHYINVDRVQKFLNLELDSLQKIKIQKISFDQIAYLQSRNRFIDSLITKYKVDIN